MAAIKRYKNAETVKLSDFITPEHFRTIMEDQLEVPGGVSEIPVVVEVSPDFSEKVQHAKAGWDGRIFGMVHNNNRINGVFAKKGDVPLKNRKIYLNDWDDKFLLLLTDKSDDTEFPFFVLPEDVLMLLNKCPYIGAPLN